MKYRKLRIAWTVVWAVVAVLLCVLWFRSGSYFDEFGWGMSAQGKLYLSPKVNLFPTDEKGATAESYQHFDGKVLTFRVRNAKLVPLASTGPVIPYWSLVLVTFLLAVAPWIRSRFSLRTLLIAVSLVAVGLGVVVYVSRN